jgi:transcriptional regulator with GAF, ATPase, and Fis domain
VKYMEIFEIIGKSRPMLGLYGLIKKVAPSNATVLIEGETGTGKELVAKAIHYGGLRCKKRFVPVHSCAFAMGLLESELFGHKKGAYTGALTDRDGKFQFADGGTLFLDEISEIPNDVQVKLLRVIQEKEFERIGENKTVKVDIRIVAATNKNLEKLVLDGKFREDLFYRLNVVNITVPPLRERIDDIPSLTNHFLAKYAKQNNKDLRGISKETIEVLKHYSFPGNVRELENIIERAVVFSNGKEINVFDLPEKLSSIYRSGVRNYSNCNIDSTKLMKILKNITIPNNGGSAKPWSKRLKAITIEIIHEFLVTTNGDWFYPKNFAVFLNNHSKSGCVSNNTIVRYLKILKTNHICDHNGKNANKSGYKIHKIFIKDT